MVMVAISKNIVDGIRFGTLARADLEALSVQEVRAVKGAGQPMRRMVARKAPLTIDVDARTVEHEASNGERDRMDDVINPAGWDLTNFSKNPVLLWSHRDDQPPIGRVLRARKAKHEDGHKALFTTSRFHEQEKYPFAELVWGMVRDGDLPGVSVCFLPQEIVRPASEEEAEEMGVGRFGVYFKRQELLELSVVTVPALASALARKLDGLAERGEFSWALISDFQSAIAESEARGRSFVALGGETRGSVPTDVSTEKAEEDAAWSAPALSDFTDEAWEDLEAAEKLRIAGHYAWQDASPPTSFSAGLKLPHHRASDGRIVWRGVAAAMAALLGGRGGIDVSEADKRRVYDHLAKHYRAFEKEPPEFHLSAPASALEIVDELAEPREIATEVRLAIRGDEIVSAIREELRAIMKEHLDSFARAARAGSGDADPVAGQRPMGASREEDPGAVFASIIEGVTRKLEAPGKQGNA
jgi:phage head maturation protease